MKLRNPEIQILAKSSRGNHRRQIAVGRHHDAGIHFAQLFTANRSNFLILDHMQHLGLHMQWQFADFVEEQGAAIGLGEQSLARLGGPGKCPLGVSEKLAFQQRFGNGAAIYRDERCLGAGTLVVYRSRQNALAGSTFTGDQYGVVDCSNPRRQALYGQHGG